MSNPKGGWCVVMPSDNPTHAARSAKSIFMAHPWLPPKDVIIVSHHMGPGGIEGGITIIRDENPSFNFSRRVNLGFTASQDRDVVVMGDDVEVIMADAFEIMKAEAPLRILAASVRGRVGPWWQREGQNHAEVPFVSFTCVYIPRMVYEIVGRLDEGFPGYGYEDTDYCIRARARGLSCGVCGSVVIEHTVGIPSSFIENFGDKLPGMEGLARAAFAKKHSWWRT